MNIPGLWPLFRAVPLYVPVLLETLESGCDYKYIQDCELLR